MIKTYKRPADGLTEVGEGSKRIYEMGVHPCLRLSGSISREGKGDNILFTQLSKYD